MNEQDSKLAQRAAMVAAIAAFALALTKFILFFATGSLIIAMSAWDSAMDMVISLVNRKIVQFARLDADDNHPYGHGRIESIASLGQGCLILGGSIAIGFSSVKQIWFSFHHPLAYVPAEGHWGYSLFFLFAMLVSFCISKWLLHYGKKLNSPALLADSQHYSVDLIVNFASAVGMFLVFIFRAPLLDSIIAFFFAFYIMFGAFQLLKTSINELMDHDLSQEIKKNVVKLIHEANPNVIDVHKLRGRKMGHSFIFDCHVTLPHSLSFNQVHEVIESLEDHLEKSYCCDMTIHADPDNVQRPLTEESEIAYV
jgi:ferrous-iron efflux pump FieF